MFDVLISNAAEFSGMDDLWVEVALGEWSQLTLQTFINFFLLVL